MPDPTQLAEARARLVKTLPTPVELLGRSAAIARVHELVRRAALSDAGVLLVADAGADVTSVARELHSRARRNGTPFVQIDCASADPARLDLWLFGTAPDAAPADLEAISRDSQVAASFGGTIFLRDIAELPASVQSRLARIARDGEVQIDGQPVTTNLRWIASASPGIESDVQTNRFRSDLYRRLVNRESTCHRSVIARRTCRRWRRVCSTTGALRMADRRERSRRRHWRFSRHSPGRGTWPSSVRWSSGLHKRPRTT